MVEKASHVLRCGRLLGVMVWLKMGGADNGAGQSQQLWHSLAREGALDNLSLVSLGEPALLCLVSEEKNKSK